MKYTYLPHLDSQVSQICFGCWAIVGGFNWGKQEASDSIAALQTAFDKGINFFDTAEMYGEGKSEELIAKALQKHRKEIVIASKAIPQNFQREALKSACENSLRRLKTDYIDLYQLHWPRHDIPVLETLGVLEELKQEGKIRAFGISNFGPKDFSECIQAGFPISSNQLAYNVLFRAIEFEILPLCLEHNVPVLTYSSLMQGLLLGKFNSADEVPDDRARTRHYASSRPLARHNGKGFEQETFQLISALREISDAHTSDMGHLNINWLLAQQGIGSVIVGGRNAQQAAYLAAAGELEIDPSAFAQISEVSDSLKSLMGPNADMWAEASRIR